MASTAVLKLTANAWPKVGRYSERDSLRRYNPQLERAKSVFKNAQSLTVERLRERAELLREEAREKPSSTVAPEAIGIAAEAVRRIRGLTAYDEQFLAALILAGGNLAEMAAGEGKTLVAALVAFVFGLQGRGSMWPR